MMKKQKGVATLVAVGVIAASIIAGAIIGKYSKINDSIAEETVETILKHHGIDCEFSPDE